MNLLFNLASTYEFLCNVWPRVPYYIPSTRKIFKPFRYFFNITNKCNLACAYCCQKTSMSQNRPELSHKEILAIVKKLPWYAVIVLSGGEPLCRTDFLDIVKGITQQKKRIALLTNGLLLNDAIICGIIQNKLLNIGIAIDGDEKYYEKIKGRGNYFILMDKINRLAYYKKKMGSSFPAFDWKVTVFPENVDQLPLLYKQAIDYGADTFTVSLPKKNDFQFSDCLHGLEILDFITESINMPCYPDNTLKIYKELFALNRRSKTTLRMYPRLKQAEDIENYFNDSQIHKRYSICREPWTGLVISAIGKTYPCLSVRIGDIKKQTLSQVLMSPENYEFRKQLKKKGLFSICDGCCYARLKPVLKKEKTIRA
jgi:MoaA/NifB/PqqE/SkfB family radical SAM enzyme